MHNDFTLQEINYSALNAGVASSYWTALEQQLARELLKYLEAPTPAARPKALVKDLMSGKIIKVECAACFNEEGSHACVRPAANALLGKEVSRTAIEGSRVVGRQNFNVAKRLPRTIARIGESTHIKVV